MSDNWLVRQQHDEIKLLSAANNRLSAKNKRLKAAVEELKEDVKLLKSGCDSSIERDARMIRL